MAQIEDRNNQSRKLVVNADGSINIIGTYTSSTVVINAIDDTAFDLNSAAYSETTALTVDYILNNIEFNFTTVSSRDITITSSDGTILFQDNDNTNMSLVLSNWNLAFDSSNQITVAVTQTNSACLMDCVLRVTRGSSSLAGDPVLGAGTAHIGSVEVDSSVLPTGASTSVKQETIIDALNVVTEGGVVKQTVQDNNTKEILENILNELKKMNIQLSTLTDDEINEDIK